MNMATSHDFQESRKIGSAFGAPPKYDDWAPTYEKDMPMIRYLGHEHCVTVLMQHFTGDPSQTSVLDVACGSGLIAKLMVDLGFKQFVGVDGSKEMLKEAHGKGLYQDLHHAFLGKKPLPGAKESFDVVTVSGGLYPGFIPVCAVRELCEAAKPGGLVCMSRGDYNQPDYIVYDEELEEELTKMESEKLWSRITATKVPHYVSNYFSAEDPDKRGSSVPGTVYVFRKY